MHDLRRELAKMPIDVAMHFLNGMFYEVYFNSKGEFRGNDLKARFVKELFALQAVDKYKETIAFIRHALAPYQQSLAILPSTSPELIKIKLMVAKKDPPIVQSIKFMGKELLGETDAEFLGPNLWKLSLKGFTVDVLRDAIAEAWHVPPEQIRIEVDPELSATSQLRLPKDKTILQPFN